VRLSADIKWIDCSSTTIRQDLSDYVCTEKLTLTKVFKGSTPPSSDEVEAIVNCGKVAKRSSFVFLRGSRNKSQIIGTCSTNRLVNLIDDFDFLKEQMEKSNLTFTVSDPRVTFDNNNHVEKADRGFLHTIRVLADLFGIIGFVSGALACLLFGELNQITLISLVLGLTFCLGSVVAGCFDQPKYILIEHESSS